MFLFTGKMDGSETERLFSGSVFESYEEFEVAFGEYQKKCGYIFTKKAASTITSYNAKQKDPSQILPVKWKYKSIVLQCKCFGKAETSGKPLKRNTWLVM